MAIPTFGGMIIQVMTIFVVPVFQAIWREGEVSRSEKLQDQLPNKETEDENNTL